MPVCGQENAREDLDIVVIPDQKPLDIARILANRRQGFVKTIYAVHHAGCIKQLRHPTAN